MQNFYIKREKEKKEHHEKEKQKHEEIQNTIKLQLKDHEKKRN